MTAYESSRIEYQQLQALRQEIAETVKQREALKQQLEEGQIKPKAGFTELGKIDTKLSQLDTQFKTLWDKHNTSAKN